MWRSWRKTLLVEVCVGAGSLFNLSLLVLFRQSLVPVRTLVQFMRHVSRNTTISSVCVHNLLSNFWNHKETLTPPFYVIDKRSFDNSLPPPTPIHHCALATSLCTMLAATGRPGVPSVHRGSGCLQPAALRLNLSLWLLRHIYTFTTRRDSVERPRKKGGFKDAGGRNT